MSLYCIVFFLLAKNKMSQLKFSLDSFRQLDLPELLINIWTNADPIHDPNCSICSIYPEYCVIAAKKKWSEFYIDFDFVINNLKKRNENWVNLGKFSTETKNNIYLYIAKNKVRTPRGTWKVLFE